MQYHRGIGTGILRAMREEADMTFQNSENGNQFKVVFYRPTSEKQISEAKVSDDMNIFSSYPNLMTLCPALPKIEQNNARMILYLCKNAASITEMMQATGYESRTSFRRKLLLPLLEAGLLVPTQAENKNNPRQKYRTSE